MKHDDLKVLEQGYDSAGIVERRQAKNNSRYVLKIDISDKHSRSGYHSAAVYNKVGNISGLIHYSYNQTTEPVSKYNLTETQDVIYLRPSLTMLENENIRHIRPLMDNFPLLVSPGCIWKHIDVMKRSKVLKICPFTVPVFCYINHGRETSQSVISSRIACAIIFFRLNSR